MMIFYESPLVFFLPIGSLFHILGVGPPVEVVPISIRPSSAPTLATKNNWLSAGFSYSAGVFFPLTTPVN